jgi:hypothetical protein
MDDPIMSLSIMDYLGPALGALVFVAGMSLVREPARQSINAILVAGAGAAYMSGGGFGIWELPYVVVASFVAWRGLAWYPAIGIAWLMHAGWDLVHHLWGNPLWPFMATSSMGCAIFDTTIALWFLAGAPSARTSERATAS